MTSIGLDYMFPEIPARISDQMNSLCRDTFGPQDKVRGFEIPFSQEQLPKPIPEYKPWGPKLFQEWVMTCRLIWSLITVLYFPSPPERKVFFVDDCNPPPSYGYVLVNRKDSHISVTIVLEFGPDSRCSGFHVVGKEYIANLSDTLLAKTEIDEYTIKCICDQLETML